MRKLRCAYCNRQMQEEFREIRKDELGRPMVHKFAFCPLCGKDIDLDLAEEGIYENTTSEENMKKINGNHGLGVISLVLSGLLVPFIPIPIPIILSLIDIVVHKEYKHTCSVLAIIITCIWYWYIFMNSGIKISFV